VLQVLIDLRANLTTRALAALFDTSQSAVDCIIQHLVGDAINHSLQIIAGLWNLKTHTQLRVNS
jgi:hypothetical protein